MYAVALVAGVVALVAWVVASSVAGAVGGWEWVDPERRLGAPTRRAVAGVVGFGMAGLSAAFAGWPDALHLAAAAAGAAAAAWYAGRFGPREG